MINVKITGLDELAANFQGAPDFLKEEIEQGLGKSLLMAEGEAKRRTPVATGNLRSSIAGSGGYSFVRGLLAGMGTNVKYAVYVETRDDLNHPVGQAHFMEDGIKAATPFIQRTMQEVFNNLAKYLTK